MYCPHCGKEIKDNVRFCPYCGQKIKPEKGYEYGDNLQNSKSDYNNSQKDHETGYEDYQQHYYDDNYNKQDTVYPENGNPDSYGGGRKKSRILFLILSMVAVLIVLFVLFWLLPKPNSEPAPDSGETADTAVAGQDISDSAITAETIHGISDTAVTAATATDTSDTAATAATTNTVTVISHTYNTYVNNTYVQCSYNTPFTVYANVNEFLSVWDTSDRGAEIRRVQPNAELWVLGQTNELYYVEIDSDTYGWVNSIYTRSSPSDTDKTVNNTDVQIKYEKPVTIQAAGSDSVTVWDDPDQGRSETSVDPDTELKAYGETDSSYYAEVVSSGEYGWINMEDVRTVISPYNENDLPPASVAAESVGDDVVFSGLGMATDRPAYAGQIGEIDGETYILPDHAAGSGLKALPVSPAEFDKICSFTYYDGRIYYCCKDEGSSDYRMALYSCKTDGSDQVLIKHFENPFEGDYNPDVFAIEDGVLYYGAGNQASLYGFDKEEYDTYAYSLSTGDESIVRDVPQAVREYLENDILYSDEGAFYRDSSGAIYQIDEDGTIQLIAHTDVEYDRNLIAVCDGKLYYTDLNPYETDQKGKLYSYDIKTRESVLLDLHEAVGGGNFYFNW